MSPGYRPLPTSDPEEQRLRDKWHATKAAAEGLPSDSPEAQAHNRIHAKLSTYLWKRTNADIEEDRRKHPKAKRNQPVQRDGESTRYLP